MENQESKGDVRVVGDNGGGIGVRTPEEREGF